MNKASHYLSAAASRLAHGTAFLTRLAKLAFLPQKGKKRILGIWDYKALPWSVGDPLIFIEKLSILKVIYNVEEIDICIVYDKEQPQGNRNVSYITPKNAQNYLLELYLPLFSTCPYLGSVFLFNSREEFYGFLKKNVERYNVFPPLYQHLSETYNFSGGEPCHLKEIEKFFENHGSIPHLKIADSYESWAKAFYRANLPENTIPVTLSLRGKSFAGQPDERDADPKVWLSFIDLCKKEFPDIVFVFIGYKEETFNGLRERANVIIAKDFGTSIMEDFALIRSSFLYIGTSSGINTIAQFSDMPYLVVQFPQHASLKYGLKERDNFKFANNVQKMLSVGVVLTPEILLEELRKFYSALDTAAWFKSISKDII